MNKAILIDDDENYIRLMVTVLKSMDIEPICFNSEEQATNFCNETPQQEIDLIISDIQMPWLESEKIANTLRKAGKLKGIPVILCSGVFGDSKNFDVEELISCYKTALHIQFIPKGNVSWLKFQIREALKLKESIARLKEAGHFEGVFVP